MNLYMRTYQVPLGPGYKQITSTTLMLHFLLRVLPSSIGLWYLWRSFSENAYSSQGSDAWPKNEKVSRRTIR